MRLNIIDFQGRLPVEGGCLLPILPNIPLEDMVTIGHILLEPHPNGFSGSTTGCDAPFPTVWIRGDRSNDDIKRL